MSLLHRGKAGFEVVEEIDPRATGELSLVEAGASSLATITEGVVLKDAEAKQPTSSDIDIEKREVASSALPVVSGPFKTSLSSQTSRQGRHDSIQVQEQSSLEYLKAKAAERLPNERAAQPASMLGEQSQQNQLRDPKPRAGTSMSCPDALVRYRMVAPSHQHRAQIIRRPEHTLDRNRREFEGSMASTEDHNPMVSNEFMSQVQRQLLPSFFAQSPALGGMFNPMHMAASPAAVNGFTFSRTQTSVRMDLNTGAMSGTQRSQRVQRNSKGQVQMDSDQREFDRR